MNGDYDYDNVLCFLECWSWRLKRLACFFKGCDISYWHESEYIGGEDCSRCDAGNDTIGNETPHKLFEGNLITRLFSRFWMNYFE
jgi:hypothetical protein